MALDNQTFIDLERDISDTGEAVNEKKIVKPRYGDPFKSLPLVAEEAELKADEVVAKGFYLGFANEAAMRAYTPSFAETRAKLDDTKKVYRWQRTSAEGVSPITGIWHDTGLSELDQAKEYVDTVSKEKSLELIGEFLRSAKSNSLALFEDSDGKVFAFFDAFAELFLTGSDISVQEMGRIANSLATMLNKNSTDKVWEIYDSDGNLGIYLDSKNELFLTGLNVSVQEALKNINVKTKHLSTPNSKFSSADLPVSEVMSSINWLKNHGIQVCDLPKNLYQQQFYIGHKWLETVSAPTKEPTDYIKIDVWNDRGNNTSWKVDSGVVHPNVIDFGSDKKLNGFRYWMGLNPYTSTFEDYELPYIFGSNDLDSWELMKNIPCPFDVDPKTNADDPTVESTSGHLSDSFFTYDTATGELFFCWRRNLYFENGRDRTKAKASIWARSTKDGINWTDKFEIYPEYTNVTGNLLLAPAILFNPANNLFYLYHVSDTINGILRYQTSPSLHNARWTDPTPVAGLESVVPYHIEAKYIGDQVVLLIHSEVTDQLYFAASDDFINFKVSKKILETDTDTYKGSFLPIFNDQNEIAFHVFYTSDQKAQSQWRLYHTQTNFNEIGA